MPSLIERTACDGLLPKRIGTAALSELPAARVTSVAPFRDHAGAVAATLAAMGLGWPAPGAAFAAAGARIQWSGRNQALLFEADPAPLAGLAALTDQSDGWARMRLEGPAAEAVLARLVPLDLRPAAFPDGRVARSALNHMMLHLARSGPASFDLMVFRSMAASAVHELATAMAAVAARGASA